jgi:hypothetical protein
MVALPCTLSASAVFLLINLLFLFITVASAGHLTLYVNQDCSPNENAVSRGIAEFMVGGNPACTQVFGIHAGQATTEIGPSCTVKLFTSTNCDPSSLAHTINTSSGTYKCLGTWAGISSISASCAANDKRSEEPQPANANASEILKRAGPDGIPIFDNQRFWWYNDGRQDIEDYVIVDNVTPAGLDFNFNIAVTGGAIAAAGGSALYTGARNDYFANEVAVTTPVTVGYRVTIIFTTMTYTPPGSTIPLRWSVGELMDAIGQDRMALLVIASASFAYHQQNTGVSFNIQYGTQQNVAVITIVFERT